jgi:hypothetical protein
MYLRGGRRQSMNRPWVAAGFRLVLLAACFGSGGCVAIPYAYPKLDYVPGYDPGPKGPECEAFCVDVTAKQRDLGETGEYTIAEITPRADGSFPAQARLTVERGHYFATLVVNYNVGRLHTTRVRLYRPGYQLIELEPWESADKAAWQPAADWAAQEKAVDDLLRRPAMTEFAAAQQKKRELLLSPGKELRELPTVAGPETTRIFLLAAMEYERIATLAPPADAARLRDKAARLLGLGPAQPAVTLRSP